jgi:hypothetical protein
MFLRSGQNVVRSALLAKGGTSKKRLSPHLHKVPTQSNKVSPQTALVCPSTFSLWKLVTIQIKVKKYCNSKK